MLTPASPYLHMIISGKYLNQHFCLLCLSLPELWCGELREILRIQISVYYTPPSRILIFLVSKISWDETNTHTHTNSSEYKGCSYKSSDCASNCAIHCAVRCEKPCTLTSVVLGGHSWGVKIFWSSPQRPMSVPHSQSHAVVPLILLNRTGLVPQHVHQGSGGKTNKDKKETWD